MNVYAEAISGYLRKRSSWSWADVLVQIPGPWPGGDIYVGKQYWATLNVPPTRNWALWRGYLSFDTSALGRKTIKSAALVFTIGQRGSSFNQDVVVFSQGAAPWGDMLDEGDWATCDEFESILAPAGLVGEVRTLIRPGSINKTGRTQFRLTIGNESVAPAGDEHLVLYGPDDLLRRPYLVIDNGNANDDVCLNIAQVLDAHKAELAVSAVHGDLPHTVSADEIAVGWKGTASSDRQRFSVDIYWIGANLGDLSGAIPSIDRAVRQKADLIRRIVIADATCNGYLTGIDSITEDYAGYPELIEWTNNDLLLGCVVRVVFLREVALQDMNVV